MKIKKIISIVLICSILCTLLAGCGKKNNVTSDNNSGTLVVELNSDDTSSEALSADDDSKNENVPIGPSATECNKAYQNFLNNEQAVFFSEYNSLNEGGENYIYSLISEKITENNYESVSFIELIKCVCEALGEFNQCISRAEEVEYSFIDAGADGIPELALRIAVSGEYDTEYLIFVIKLIDEKLQCVFVENYSYRTYGQLFDYGLYISSGSYGASSIFIEYYFITANGNVIFDYGIVDSLDPYEYIDNLGEEELEEIYDSDVYDSIEIVRYYTSLSGDEGEDYSEYLNNCFYTYYDSNNTSVDTEGNDQTEIFKSDSPYRQFWDKTGLPLYTEKEIEDKLIEHENKLGITEELSNANEATWLSVSDAQLEYLNSWRAENVVSVTLDNPGWEYYYYDGTPTATTKKTLSVGYSEPNEIIDEEEWFSRFEMSVPDRLSFTDDLFLYNLYGTDSDGLAWYPYMMDICDFSSGEVMYTLDFSNYYYPDEYVIGDVSFVEESIHYATVEDDILYVSTFHNTYAESAPHNGYITAFDMNDNFKVLWRTEPLTCNSNNFVIVDDAIICGYGFTNEPDYVYVLDKATGLRTNTLKVKTGPDYFIYSGGSVFVRCYDTNYELVLEE